MKRCSLTTGLLCGLQYVSPRDGKVAVVEDWQCLWERVQEVIGRGDTASHFLITWAWTRQTALLVMQGGTDMTTQGRLRSGVQHKLGSVWSMWVSVQLWSNWRNHSFCYRTFTTIENFIVLFFRKQHMHFWYLVGPT